MVIGDAPPPKKISTKFSPLDRRSSRPGNSASASLNEPLPLELQQLALNFLATFLVVTLQNNNRHTSARAHNFFPYVT